MVLDQAITQEHDETLDFLVGTLSSFLEQKHPGLVGGDPEMIRGNSNFREHSPGIVSIQYGKAVCYAFDLTVNGVGEKYERMCKSAKQGLLSGEDLLIGLFELHEVSRTEDSRAYLITTAAHRRRYD